MRRNLVINIGFLLANLALLLFLSSPGLAFENPEIITGDLELPQFWVQPPPLQELPLPPSAPAPVTADSPGIHYRLPTQDKVVALTFDDGPKGTVGKLLSILAEKNVPGTFFLLGNNALNRPQLVQDIAKAGHDIGNHSWSHPNLRGMSQEHIHWQIESCKVVFDAIGVEMQPLMRPPYGGRDGTVLSVTAELGYQIILWDVDTRDWEFDDPAVVLERALSGLKPGSIVLFHDGPKVTLEVLPLFIDEALAQGYRFVLVSEFIH